MMSQEKSFLTIVSGLPRSGTSMMMRMLDVAGMPVLIDEVRQADDDNPRGYYEFEPVKKTKQNPAWVQGSDGKAVKMVYRLLYDLPTDHRYRVLFMRRKFDEVLASQRVMLERNGMSDGVNDDQMAAMFKAQLADFEKWAARQPHIDMLEVSYNRLVDEPQAEIAKINEFLGGDLDTSAMREVVDLSLYRNRSAST